MASTQYISFNDIGNNPLSGVKVKFSPWNPPFSSGSITAIGNFPTDHLITDDNGYVTASLFDGLYEVVIESSQPKTILFGEASGSDFLPYSASAPTGSRSNVQINMWDIMSDYWDFKTIKLTNVDQNLFFSGSFLSAGHTSSITDDSGSVTFTNLVPGVKRVDALSAKPNVKPVTWFIRSPDDGGTSNINDLRVYTFTQAIPVKLNPSDAGFVGSITFNDNRYAFKGQGGGGTSDSASWASSSLSASISSQLDSNTGNPLYLGRLGGNTDGTLYLYDNTNHIYYTVKASNGELDIVAPTVVMNSDMLDFSNVATTQLGATTIGGLISASNFQGDGSGITGVITSSYASSSSISELSTNANTSSLSLKSKDELMADFNFWVDNTKMYYVISRDYSFYSSSLDFSDLLQYTHDSGTIGGVVPDRQVKYVFAPTAKVGNMESIHYVFNRTVVLTKTCHLQAQGDSAAFFSATKSFDGAMIQFGDDTNYINGSGIVDNIRFEASNSTGSNTGVWWKNCGQPVAIESQFNSCKVAGARISNVTASYNSYIRNCGFSTGLNDGAGLLIDGNTAIKGVGQSELAITDCYFQLGRALSSSIYINGNVGQIRIDRNRFDWTGVGTFRPAITISTGSFYSIQGNEFENYDNTHQPILFTTQSVATNFNALVQGNISKNGINFVSTSSGVSGVAITNNMGNDGIVSHVGDGSGLTGLVSASFSDTASFAQTFAPYISQSSFTISSPDNTATLNINGNGAMGGQPLQIQSTPAGPLMTYVNYLQLADVHANTITATLNGNATTATTASYAVSSSAAESSSYSTNATNAAHANDTTTLTNGANASVDINGDAHFHSISVDSITEQITLIGQDADDTILRANEQFQAGLIVDQQVTAPRFIGQLTGSVKGTATSASWAPGITANIQIFPDGKFVYNGTIYNPISTTCGIQEAINMLPTASNWTSPGGGTLTFAPGIYYIYDAIYAPTSSTIQSSQTFSSSMYPFHLAFAGSGMSSCGIIYTGSIGKNAIVLGSGPFSNKTYKLSNMFFASDNNATASIVYFKGGGGPDPNNAGVATAEVEFCWFGHWNSMINQGIPLLPYNSTGHNLSPSVVAYNAKENLIGIRADMNYGNVLSVRDCQFTFLACGISNACDHISVIDNTFSNCGRRAGYDNDWSWSMPYRIGGAIICKDTQVLSSPTLTANNNQNWVFNGNTFISTTSHSVCYFVDTATKIPHTSYNDFFEVDSNAGLIATKGTNWTFVNPYGYNTLKKYSVPSSVDYSTWSSNTASFSQVRIWDYQSALYAGDFTFTSGSIMAQGITSSLNGTASVASTLDSDTGNNLKLGRLAGDSGDGMLSLYDSANNQYFTINAMDSDLDITAPLVSVNGDFGVSGTITGTLIGNVTGSVTGNLIGTASLATQAKTASLATSFSGSSVVVTAGGSMNLYSGSNASEIYTIADPANTSTPSLFIVPPGNNTRLYLGTAAKPMYSVNFTNVTNIESFPSVLTMKASSGISKIASAGGSDLVFDVGSGEGNNFISSNKATNNRRSLAFKTMVGDSDSFKRTAGFIFTHASSSAQYHDPHTIWTTGNSEAVTSAIMKLDMSGSLSASRFTGNQYGSCFNTNNDAVVSVASSDTFYKIDGGLTSSYVNGFTFNNQMLTSSVPGKFAVDWTLAVKATANNEIEATVFINSTSSFFSGSTSHTQVFTTNMAQNIAGCGILSLNTNDAVGICVKNNTAASDITINHANLKLVRLGD